MKIRHPLLIGAVGFLGAFLIRAWMRTIRVDTQAVDYSVDPRTNPKQRYIYAFWHENLLLPAFLYRHCGAAVLISKHADGEMIGQVIRRLGFGLIRGSTNKGGAKALLEMVRAGEHHHLGITPDGPRGPRREVQPGIALLAAATGLPVLPIGIAYRSAWRAKSWDRFGIPKPFSRAGLIAGPVIQVPITTDYSQLSELRRRIQNALDEVGKRAEYWQEKGRFLETPFPEQVSPSQAA